MMKMKLTFIILFLTVGLYQCAPKVPCFKCAEHDEQIRSILESELIMLADQDAPEKKLGSIRKQDMASSTDIHEALIQEASLVSFNFASFFVKQVSSKVKIVKNKYIQKFAVVRGLDGSEEGCVSIRTLESPIKYLVSQPNSADMIFMERDGSVEFDERATFKVHYNKFFNNYHAFEGIKQYKNKFVRHQNYYLRFHQQATDDLYKRDASFAFVNVDESVTKLESRNFRSFYLSADSVSHHSSVRISKTNTYKEFKVVQPGLTGQAGTVSFMEVQSNGYLRTVGEHLKLGIMDGNYQNQKDWQKFQEDSTYFIDYDRYFTNTIVLESSTKRGYFLRHQGYVLKLHQEQPTVDLYKNDASFYMTSEYKKL